MGFILALLLRDFALDLFFVQTCKAFLSLRLTREWIFSLSKWSFHVLKSHFAAHLA
jgi:hypothetical protein